MADNYEVIGFRFSGEDDGLVREAERAQKAIAELEKGLKEVAALASKHASGLSNSSREVGRYAIAVDKVVKAEGGLNTTMSDLTNQVSKYQRNLSRLRAEYNLLQANNDKAAKAIRDVNKGLEAGDIAAIDAANAKKALSAQIDVNTAKMDQLAQEYDEQRQQIVSLAGASYSLTDATQALTTAEQKQLLQAQAAANAYDEQQVALNKLDGRMGVLIAKRGQLYAEIQKEQRALEMLANEQGVDSALMKERSFQLQGMQDRYKELSAQIEQVAEKYREVQIGAKAYYETLRQQGRAVEEFGRGVRDIGQTINAFGRAYSAVVTVPFAATLALSTKAAMDFESAFAGVIKTVDGLVRPGSLTGLTLLGEQIREELLELSTIIPATFEEISKIAEISGQLGVPAREIVGFTRIIAEFAESTNVESEEAAQALAQIANVFGVAKDQIDEFADAATNAIVDLGNNFATTEADIIGFFQSFAGAAASFGVLEQDALAIATAFKSVRAQTASSTTGIQKTLLAMSTAVEDGGEALQRFADASDMSAEQFARTWESRPAEAFAAFLEGVRDAGNAAPDLLRSLGLGDQRIIREFLKAASGVDVLYEALERANEAFGNFGENGARAVEAARRFATVESQTKLLVNEFRALAVIIGEQLVPFLREMVASLRPVARSIAEIVKNNPSLVQMGVVIGGIAAALGPVILAFGSLVTVVGNAISGIGSMAIGFATVNASAAGASAAMYSFAGVTGTAGAAASGTTGLVSALSASMGTLKATAAAAWTAFAPVLGIGVLVAAVAGAVASLAVNVNRANSEVVDAQEIYTDAAIQLENMSDEVRRANVELMDAADNYTDYAAAADLAGLGATKLSQAQYNLIQATREFGRELDPVIASVIAFKDEISDDNFIVRFFADYNQGITKMAEAASDTSDSLPELIENAALVAETADEMGESLALSTDANREIITRVFELADGLEDARKALVAIYGSEGAAELAIARTLGEASSGRGLRFDELTEQFSNLDDETIKVTQSLTNMFEEFRNTLGITGELSDAARSLVISQKEVGGTAQEAALLAVTTGVLREGSFDLTAAMTILSDAGMRWGDVTKDLIVTEEELLNRTYGLTDASIELTNVQLQLAKAVSEGINSIGSDVVSKFVELEGLFKELSEAQVDALAGDPQEIQARIAETQQAILNSYRNLAVELSRLTTDDEGNVITGRLTEDTVALAVALNVMTAEQGRAALAAQNLNSEMQRLLTALQLTNLSAEQQAAAIELLSRGFVSTASEAYALVTTQEDLIPAVLAAADAMDEEAASAQTVTEEVNAQIMALYELARAQDKVADTAKKSASDIIRASRQTAGGAAQAKKAIDDQATSFVSFLEKMREAEEEEEEFDMVADTIGDWEIALLDAAAAAGGTLDQIALLAVATGELSEEQAKSILNLAIAQKAIEGIADAYVNGSISADEAAGALGSVIEAVNSGSDLDLAAFGISLSEPMDQVASSAGGAQKEVKTLGDVYRETLIDMAKNSGIFTEDQILQLEVQLGIITPTQAEEEAIANEVIESLRAAMGVLLIDNVPVTVDPELLGVDNPEQFIADIEAAAGAGADPSKAIELTRMLAVNFDVSQQQADEILGEVLEALTGDPDISPEDAVIDAFVGFKIADEAELRDTLGEFADTISSIAPEEEPHQVQFETNVQEKLPEVQNLKNLLNDITLPQDINLNWDKVDEAIERIGDLDALIAEDRTIEIGLEFFQGEGASVTEPESNYHGGLFRAPAGRDRGLSYISDREYIMPSYVVNQPGVLKMLDALRVARGDVWEAAKISGLDIGTASAGNVARGDVWEAIKSAGMRFDSASYLGGGSSTTFQNDNRRISTTTIQIDRPVAHSRRISIRDRAAIATALNGL